MIPQRRAYSHPRFANEETEAERLRSLPKLPDLISSGARHPPSSPCMTLLHSDVILHLQARTEALSSIELPGDPNL